MTRKLFAIFLFTLITGNALAQVTYPDVRLPADTPRLFATGILSDGLSNRDFTISPKGDELFFTLQQPRFVSSTILHMIKNNGKWSKPQVAPFSGKYRDLEATFSPDGQTIYFSSDRPLKDTGAKKDFDIWRIKRATDGTWGKPENLGTTVNSSKNEFYPSITRSGNLYFTVEAAYGKGSEDIVVCKPTDTGHTKPISLPEDINTKYDEFNAFVDPDEQFILFTSYGRPDDLGGGDLYISRKDNAGNWLPVKHLPAPINTPYLDYCPFVSWDKKYLVFTSNRLNKELANRKTKTYQQLQQILNSPGNGWDDIYWVKFDTKW
ncbi:WD40-like Beta Propeller Repeat [Mucilaginibacter pineti]|uniref:WD40-like Beta Propeller Repeat n=1 Tax=Mucilaginibacter pineti TaxID=1391627 RepID=A0A1G6X380_9SPHI|nr:PD40 domain-containing protein [Mucilaginibacter pineti]SDD72581.1 WD40-like Beta Propeller Repeat [Mucilaginibacter pineti]